MLLQSTATPHWSAQVQSVGVGIGTFLAGLGGLKVIWDWVEQERLKRKVAYLLSKYPLNKLNKDYRLVKKDDSDKWWLLDELAVPKSRHWVHPYDTVRDMGWQGDGNPKKISQAELDKYHPGDEINTRKL